MWKWLQTLRGVRIINVLVGLFFSVHLLACGWYMCASLHTDATDGVCCMRVHLNQQVMFCINCYFLCFLHFSPGHYLTCARTHGWRGGQSIEMERLACSRIMIPACSGFMRCQSAAVHRFFPHLPGEGC